MSSIDHHHYRCSGDSIGAASFAMIDKRCSTNSGKSQVFKNVDKNVFRADMEGRPSRGTSDRKSRIRFVQRFGIRAVGRCKTESISVCIRTRWRRGNIVSPLSRRRGCRALISHGFSIQPTSIVPTRSCDSVVQVISNGPPSTPSSILTRSPSHRGVGDRGGGERASFCGPTLPRNPLRPCARTRAPFRIFRSVGLRSRIKSDLFARYAGTRAHSEDSRDVSHFQCSWDRR